MVGWLSYDWVHFPFLIWVSLCKSYLLLCSPWICLSIATFRRLFDSTHLSCCPTNKGLNAHMEYHALFHPLGNGFSLWVWAPGHPREGMSKADRWGAENRERCPSRSVLLEIGQQILLSALSYWFINTSWVNCLKEQSQGIPLPSSHYYPDTKHCRQSSWKLCLTLWDPMDLQHTWIPCPLPSPGVCSNSCPLSQWCHPTISSSVSPFFSCPQSFPPSESFPLSWLFT